MFEVQIVQTSNRLAAVIKKRWVLYKNSAPFRNNTKKSPAARMKSKERKKDHIRAHIFWSLCLDKCVESVCCYYQKPEMCEYGSQDGSLAVPAYPGTCNDISRFSVDPSRESDLY